MDKGFIFLIVGIILIIPNLALYGVPDANIPKYIGKFFFPDSQMPVIEFPSMKFSFDILDFAAWALPVYFILVGLVFMFRKEGSI
jgi:hypothetical protein